MVCFSSGDSVPLRTGRGLDCPGTKNGTKMSSQSLDSWQVVWKLTYLSGLRQARLGHRWKMDFCRCKSERKSERTLKSSLSEYEFLIAVIALELKSKTAKYVIADPCYYRSSILRKSTYPTLLIFFILAQLFTRIWFQTD